MVAFDIILDNFANWAAQMDRMIAFGTILEQFANQAAQTVQMVAFIQSKL